MARSFDFGMDLDESVDLREGRAITPEVSEQGSTQVSGGQRLGVIGPSNFDLDRGEVVYLDKRVVVAPKPFEDVGAQVSG
jgi:hypothetical protein